MDAAVADLCAALYSQRHGEPLGETDKDAHAEHILTRGLKTLLDDLRLACCCWDSRNSVPFDDSDADMIVRQLAADVPEVRAVIDSDVEEAFLGDLTARSVDEILICYPYALAKIHHSLASRLHGFGAPFITRIISEPAISRTGMDTHGDASLAPNFSIGPRAGSVIGEIAIIKAAQVRCYQMMTLGGRGLTVDGDDGVRCHSTRHPIMKDDVVIYFGAIILGRRKIGRGSAIGGNVWLIEGMPAGNLVAQDKVDQLTSRQAPTAQDDWLAR